MKLPGSLSTRCDASLTRLMSVTGKALEVEVDKGTRKSPGFLLDAAECAL